MNLRYRFPSGVQTIVALSGLVLTTPQGGKVVVDASILALWQYINGRNLTEIIRDFHKKSLMEIRAALACLAEAGLLLRNGETRAHSDLPRVVGNLVSVIIVTYNSINWLPDCLDSLSIQTYSPLEIIVVDNASSDGSAAWVATHFPNVKLVRLTAQQSLAYAINRGTDIARGDYWLILNPDTRLEPDAVAQMVTVAREDVNCAAVAAKLKFLWAPAFLNGLGNYVGAFSWATDSGLGHLDLGQFDTWREVPSACFAAALISRAAWERIGALDENFFLYYEDTEWCYRARLMGYTIRAAPQAIVYHAFGSRLPSDSDRGMPAEKLRNVVYGRLRFAVKLLRSMCLVRFLLTYGCEDCLRFCCALLRLDLYTISAYLRAWRDFAAALPALRHERDAIQAKRVVSDRALFDLQKEIPPPLIWNGLPQLTWDLVQSYYLPLILAGKTRVLPEFSDVDIEQVQQEFVAQTRLARVRAIWRNEGGRALLHRVVRYLQWRLALV